MTAGTTPTTPAPLIALISATPAAIGPAANAIGALFPEATVWNILDDRLLKDADRQGGLTPPLADRMQRLIDHALTEGADGVLLTCSLYGPVAHRIEGAAVPILAADDAAFATAVASGHGRILVVASFQAALTDAVARFSAAVATATPPIEVLGAVAEGAFAATASGDGDALLASLVQAGRAFEGRIDAVLLAQYTLAPFATAMSAELGIPVISGPDAAATTLRARLLPEAAGADPAAGASPAMAADARAGVKA